MDQPCAAHPLPVEDPESRRARPEIQRCPGCGQDMPALKGARLSICPVCGYKESCCY